jgi:hypothetical protein
MRPERFAHERPRQPLFERGELVLELGDLGPQITSAIRIFA